MSTIFKNINELDMGTFTQEVYSTAIYGQLSEDFSDWDMLKSRTVNIPSSKLYNYDMVTGYAPAGTQRVNPGQSNRPFPKPFSIGTQEGVARFKEIAQTIAVDAQLVDRLQKSGQKADAISLAQQIYFSGISQKRVLAKEIYQDGTGRLGYAASATAGGDGKFTVTLDSSKIGHVGWFDRDDILVHTNATNTGAGGSAVTGGTADHAYWKVLERNRRKNQITLQSLNSSFQETTVDTWTPAATDTFLRFGQPEAQSGVVGVNLESISDDLGLYTPMVGLESLAANDGRLVHQVNLSGFLGATHEDAEGEVIDVKHIEANLNDLKINTGGGTYNWKYMCMAPETRSALVEGRETDRRFHAVKDDTRGVVTFRYIHEDDNLEVKGSEFIPKDVIWHIPEAKGSNKKVIELVNDDIAVVKTGNMADFHLGFDAATGSRTDTYEQYLRGHNMLICTHPASVGKIKGFTIS